MANEETATFRLDLDGNLPDVADDASGAMEKLRDRLERGESSLRALENAYKRLNAATVVEIGAAKELQTRIQSQKDSLAKLHVEAFKAGTSYDKLSRDSKNAAKAQADLKKKLDAAAEKKAKEQTDALGGALRSISPRVAELKEKFAGLGENLQKAGGMTNVAALGVVGLTAVLAACAVAVIALGVAAVISFTKFVIESGNAQRSAMLLRAAVAGSADNTKALGNQVDALANKVPTAKAELNELAISLRKSGLSGQTLVDTLNAVGQASAAVGDETGAKLKEIIDRSKMTGRLAIAPLELVGTGLKFDEVASSLAKNLNVGLNDARAALMTGRVKLADGAAAIRTAVEAKFGKINAAKMLDLDTLVLKFKENLASLTKNVNLEPLLNNLKSIFDLFSTDTVTGVAIQHLVEMLGQGLVGAVGESTPILKTFIEGLVLGALTLENKVLRLRIALRDAFGDPKVSSDMLDMTLVLKIGQAVMWGLAAGTLAVVGGFVVFAATAATVTAGLIRLIETAKKVAPALNDVLGSVSPSGANKMGQKMGSSLKTGFKDAIGWHSPPAFFVQAREESEEAFAGKPFDTPVTDVAPIQSARAAARGGGGSVERHYHFHVDSQKTADAMGEPSFLAKLTKAVEEAELESGMPLDGEPA